MAEIERLQAQAESMTVQNQTGSATVQSLMASLSAMQSQMQSAREELTQLQKLNAAYQFRLLPGEDGKVFVRVPSQAQTVVHEGQTFIEVAQ